MTEATLHVDVDAGRLRPRRVCANGHARASASAAARMVCVVHSTHDDRSGCDVV